MEYPVPDPLEVGQISSRSIPATYVVWTDGSKVYADPQGEYEAEFSGTDAASVIQDVANHISNGTIFIQKGDFSCSSTINLRYDDHNGLNIIGSGILGTTLSFDSGVEWFKVEGAHFVSIKDLDLVAGSPYNLNYGIRLTDDPNTGEPPEMFDLENLKMHRGNLDLETVSAITQGGRVKNIWIRPPDTLPAALRINEAVRITFENMDINGRDVTRALSFLGNTNELTFINCMIQKSTDHGIYVDTGLDIGLALVGGKFEGNPTSNIHLDTNVTGRLALVNPTWGSTGTDIDGPECGGSVAGYDGGRLGCSYLRLGDFRQGEATLRVCPSGRRSADAGERP